jgi:hypothetical protein
MVFSFPRKKCAFPSILHHYYIGPAEKEQALFQRPFRQNYSSFRSPAASDPVFPENGENKKRPKAFQSVEKHRFSTDRLPAPA